MTKALVKVGRIFHPPTQEKTKECWRCGIELRGDGEVHQKHCPRCCHDLNDAPIDLEEIVDADERRSWIAAMDLGNMYQNWASGHIRVMYERNEPDYSALDDFVTTVMENSFPYLSRLLKTGILSTTGMEYLRGVLNDCTLRIIQEADKLFLEGGEDEKEKELREYWLNKLCKTNSAVQLYSVSPTALCYDSKCEDEG